MKPELDFECKARDPKDVMMWAIAYYQPVKVWALFSGGKDSIVSTHLSMENGAHEVLHINTGIGIRECREYVRDVCYTRKWPLRELHPPDKTFRDFVLKYGFPGPGGHKYSYVWLKERALMKLTRETKTKRSDRVMFCTGVRNLESARRMGYVEPVVRTGARVWVAPIYQMNDIDMANYRKAHNLQLSEVSRRFGMSGECLCGAFAAPGEMERLEATYPEAAAQIHILEDEAREAGVHCEWGKRPKRGGRLSMELPFMPLCVGCPTKAALRAAIPRPLA